MVTIYKIFFKNFKIETEKLAKSFGSKASEPLKWN